MDASQTIPQTVSGLLDISTKGNFGHLLDLNHNGRHREQDVYVPQSLIQKLRLRSGQYLEGQSLQDSPEKPPRMIHIATIDGLTLNERRQCLRFADATTTSPHEQLLIETDAGDLGGRLIDLFAPLGRGQRALIVAPPKTGKTTLLQEILRGVAKNHPDCHRLALLVDERPEEVTDFKRHVPAEIFASSNDEAIQRHIRISELAFQRAQNLVETGRDVVLVMDSLTRLARAYNNALGKSGRTMTGGLDTQALEKPRQLFSMARRTEEIGSLTIVATALIETGSRMDDFIFQEFKGTGNCEIVLDRRAAEQRLFPAMNLQSSGTRREELLLSPEALNASQFLHRSFVGGRPDEILENLLQRIKKTKNNREFIALLQRGSFSAE